MSAWSSCWLNIDYTCSCAINTFLTGLPNDRYLLAYSCKTRYFCPSCHQNRVLLYCDWVEANVLAPVPHRQYVFTVPKLLRPAFGRHRTWLGELCRIAARLLVEAYAEAAPGADPVRADLRGPGQLQPARARARRRRGVPSGWNVCPPAAGARGASGRGISARGAGFLVRQQALSEPLRSRMLGWPHSGFSAHNQVRVAAGDPEGRKKLAGYMLRAPMSLEKMSYD